MFDEKPNKCYNEGMELYNFVDFLFSTQFMLYALISFVPIMGWLFIFQKIHKQKRWYVFITFLAGMFSVLPMKMYERFIKESIWYFEHLNLFQHLGDLMHLPEAPKLLSYIIANTLVAFAIFLFAALLMFILEVFITGDNTADLFFKKFRKIIESPFIFLNIGVIVGVLAYLSTTYLQQNYSFDFSFTNRVSFFIVVGMLEEYIKYLMLRFSDEEKIHSVDDAISFSIIIAFGFAFIENIMYLKNFADNMGNNIGSLGVFLILRSIISVGAHVCFSAICGYFYGISLFSHEITHEEIFKIRHRVLDRIHKTIHIKVSTLFHEEKLFQGLFAAMITHAIFNILLQFNLLIPTIIYLGGLFFLVIGLFHHTHYRKKTPPPENADSAPSEFFETLPISK